MKFIDRSKIPPPEIFNSDKFYRAKQKLESFFEHDYKQIRFKFDSIIWMKSKEDLRNLFGSKCAYCESQIDGSSFGVVDHFRPKSSSVDLDGKQSDGYWWLAYDWNNLYLSCEVCNRHKRNKFPVEGKRAENYQSLSSERYLLVDPCNKEDVSSARFYYEHNGKIASLSNKGKITIELLSLNRSELCLRRSELIKHLEIEFTTIENLSPSERSIACKRLKEKYARNEYQSLIDYYMNLWSFPTDEQDLLDLQPSLQKDLETKCMSDNIKTLQDNALIESQEYPKDFYQRTKIIKRIEIKNFKSIEELSFDFPEAYGEQESWMMIIGENGVGKSTILQAIALALSGQNHLNDLEVNWENFIKRRSGARKAQVILHLSNVQSPITLTITKKGAKLSPEEPQVLVLGYGSTRLLPKEKTVEKSETFKPNIQNLFDHYSQLKNVESWLSDPTRVPPNNFNNMSKSLRELLMLPGFNDNNEILIRRRSGKITVNLGGSPQNIYDLCDGYQSVLAYVLDIMMSINSLWPSPENAQGVVLLDEIETHLHPSWKIRIVSLLRNIFPLLNFIVTTHDPLCLRGAKKGEVRILNFSDDNKITMESIDIPLGLPIEELLVGVWFKMESTLDEDTISLVKRHSKLVLQPKCDSSEEKQEIELKLKDRISLHKFGGLFGSYLETLEETLKQSDRKLSEEQVADGIRRKLKKAIKGKE